MLACFIVTL